MPRTGDPAAPAAIELALGRIELLYALVSSLIGIPMVFSGDELALTNDYSWETDPELAEDNRWMHRPHLDWKAAKHRTRPGTIESRIFGWIRDCFARRRAIPAFAQDSPFEVLPSPSENILLCRRGTPGGVFPTVVVAANFAPEPRVLNLSALGMPQGGATTDLLGQKKARVEAEWLVLEAYGIAWLVAAAPRID